MAELKKEAAEGSSTAPPPTERGKNHYKNRAKKQKRNKFLKNAKSFGKRESFGRGAELEQTEYNYLVAILETMTKEKDTEERQLIANNVLGQLKGKEIRTASNQVGSRIMEDLLAYTDEETFAGLLETFAQNFRVFCCDKFASHVLQRTLYVALLRAVAPLQTDQQGEEDGEGEEQSAKKQKAGGAAERGDRSVWPCYEYCLKEQYADEHRQTCRQYVERMAKYLINNLEEFVWEATAGYVIRQCVLNLGGITEKKATNDAKPLTVPEQWHKLLHEFNVQLMAWPQFADLIGMEQTATILQDLLRALASTDDAFQLEQLIAKLFKEAFYTKKVKKEEKDNGEATVKQEEKSDLPKAFQSDSSIRLLEVCIVVAPAAFLKDKLFSKLFRGHVKQLALSRACNFAIQKLIDHTTDKDMMDMVFAELEDSMEDLLQTGHTGVVLALAKACARLACQQGKFVKNLLDALHCVEVAPTKMINAVLHLLPANVTPSTAPKIHLHGSLILQAILDFNKPIKFVTALLEMPNDRLAEILSEPAGSFVANAFVTGRFVGEKSREKLVRHLEGQYAQLTLSVHGSRVVEIMYEAGNPAQRENIVRELAEQCERLNGKPWSAKVNKRLLVDLYKRNPARWKVAIKNDAKVEKMFDKLVGGKKRKAES
ncbi:nucleolar protein 9 [Anopheles gambiae]|uniref:nucleolar protein 9 n=1 Tax=Anopheles gambiae TaxID=7165 RepID=UPI002AC97DD3|nr:nucleolar protein 9 [Anopheles gambiae]